MTSILRFDEWQDSNGVPVLDGTGLAIPSSALPTGTILQVLSAEKTDTFTMSTTTFTLVTGLSQSITPRSTSSKILVIASVPFTNTSTANSGHLRLMRGATAVFIGDAAGSRTRAAVSVEKISSNTGVSTISFLDSPNTTSAVSYSIQVRSNNTQPVYVNRTQGDTDSAVNARFAASITVMEVAG